MTDIDAIIALVQGQQWAALGAVCIGLLVRLSKSKAAQARLPIPARYRPLLALALGLAQSVLEVAATGAPWADALVHGVVAAALAALGHGVGVEGLRGGRELGRPRLARAPGTVAMLVLCVSCAGCTPAQWAQVASAAADIASGAGWVREQFGTAEQASAAYFARHPSPLQAEVEIYLGRVHRRVDELAAGARVVEAGGQADLPALAAAVVDAWAAARALLAEVGVLDARVPSGGAETESEPPVPVSLPTAAEVAGRLGA